MVSEEVKMIQRDHPAPTFSEADPNTLRPPGAGQTVDPEAVGENVAPGRMGANDTPTQEGPLAQGVGRVVDAAEDAVADTTKLARGARTPHDSVTEPTQGGASVLDATAEGSPLKTFSSPGPVSQRSSRVAETVESSKPSTDEVSRTLSKNERFRTRRAAELSLSNVARFRRDLKSGNYGTSTIAGNRFDSMITDQGDQATRGVGYYQATRSTRNQRTSKSSLKTVVAGKEISWEHLPGKAFDQEPMKQIAKVTTMNGTYMRKDTRLFLDKMRTLLPKADSARA